MLQFNMAPSGRVFIIGSGNVGSACAYSLLTSQNLSQIFLIDPSKDLLEGQVMDLSDSAAMYLDTTVNIGDYSDLQEGDIVIVTCGVSQKVGQTRLDLLKVNSEIMLSVAEKINQSGKKVYVVIVANPVDELTEFLVQKLNIDPRYILGTGTYLDSARLKIAISDLIQIKVSKIEALVFGEHGNSSVPILSQVKVDGRSLSEFINLDNDLYKEISKLVRQRAYKIIEKKQSTYFGIASVVNQICTSIITSKKLITPLSIKLTGQYGISDVTLSILCELTAEGVKASMPITINPIELQMLRESAKVLKESVVK